MFFFFKAVEYLLDEESETLINENDNFTFLKEAIEMSEEVKPVLAAQPTAPRYYLILILFQNSLFLDYLEE